MRNTGKRLRPEDFHSSFCLVTTCFFQGRQLDRGEIIKGYKMDKNEEEKETNKLASYCSRRRISYKRCICIYSGPEPHSVMRSDYPCRIAKPRHFSSLQTSPQHPQEEKRTREAVSRGRERTAPECASLAASTIPLLHFILSFSSFLPSCWLGIPYESAPARFAVFLVTIIRINTQSTLQTDGRRTRRREKKEIKAPMRHVRNRPAKINDQKIETNLPPQP